MDRICMFTPSAGGGHALYTQELLTALAAHPRGGRKFELITGEDLEAQFRTGSYTIHDVMPELKHRRQFKTTAGWMWNRATHYPLRERALLKWLEAQPDVRVVHFQEFALWLGAPLVRRIRRMGKRVVYTCHNFVAHKTPPLVSPKLYNHWHRRTCLACDALLVHTQAMAGELAGLLGDPHPPIQVVPHGVWTSLKPKAIPSIEERLNWKKLLFFGIIRRNKGLDLLLEAARSLPGYSLTIAGDPSEKEYFEREAMPKIRQLQESGMSIEVIPRFVSDDEAAELFATHSAVVLPYKPEFKGASGVAFMGLVNELPIVAGNFGAVGELFDQFKIGRTFGEFTASHLAAAIRDLFEKADRAELVAQLRAAKRGLSWETAAVVTNDLYSKVLSEKPVELEQAPALAGSAQS